MEGLQVVLHSCVLTSSRRYGGAWWTMGLLAHEVIIQLKTRGVPTRSDFMWQHEPCVYRMATLLLTARVPYDIEAAADILDRAGWTGPLHLLVSSKRPGTCHGPYSATCLRNIYLVLTLAYT